MNNLTETQIDHIVNSLKFVSELELEDIFEEYLDEAYGTVSVCNYEYSQANIFKKIDPIAYREEFDNWLDTELRDNILVEINGDYYFAEQVQDALDSLEENSIYNMAESDLEVENE